MTGSEIVKFIKALQRILPNIAQLGLLVVILFIIVMICFYLVWVPWLLKRKKRKQIRQLEHLVQKEIENFLAEKKLCEGLQEGAEEILSQLEVLYSKEWRKIYPNLEQQEKGNDNVLPGDPEDLSLLKKWKYIEQNYGI